MLIKNAVQAAVVCLLLPGFVYSEFVWALSSKQRAKVYSKSPQTVKFSKNMAAVDSAEWLYNQIYTAELMYRDDIVEAALERVMAIEPDNMTGLAAQARLAIQRNDLPQAKKKSARASELYPNQKEVLLLQSYVAAYTNKAAAYRKVKLLTKLGRTQDAIKSYESLFPHGMPTNLIKLEYLSLLGENKANWYQVRSELEQMNYQLPGVPVLQLRLATHLMKRQQPNAWMLSTLQRIALDPNLGRQAADAWLRALTDMPVSASWAKQHALLSSYFPQDLEIKQANKTAQARWEQEQEWLKDPTYIAKLRGIALLKTGNPDKLAAAYKQLSYAMTTRPKDSELLDAMGKYYLRQGQAEQALSYFKRARRYDDDPDNQSKYRSLLHTARYWTYLERGDTQIEQANFIEAEKNYLKALSVSPNIVYGYNRLANLAVLQLNYPQALTRYQQALEKEPLNKTALRGLLRTYSRQGQYKEAITKAKTLSLSQQKMLRDDISALEVKVLVVELQGYSAEQDKLQIAKVVDQLIKISPTDPSLRTEIAEHLYDKGFMALANRLMKDWAESSRDPVMQYAYAEYLFGHDKSEEAVAVLGAIPVADRSEIMAATLERYKFDLAVNKAIALYDENPEQAVELLQSYVQPKEVEGRLRLASAWVHFGDSEKAKAVISSLDLKQLNNDSLLTYGGVLVDVNDDASFQQWRLVARERQPLFDYSHHVKWASVLYAADASQEATQLLSQLAERPDGKAVDKWRSLSIAMENRQWDMVEKLAYQTLKADRQEKQSVTQSDEKAISLETMYNEADDYWLTRNVKSAIDTLRAREDGHIKIGFDYGFREGEGKESQIPFEARIPFAEYDGHLVVKIDNVHVDSGEESFYDSGDVFNHDDSGTSVGIGWEAETWRADIGTTPIGFLNTQIVGGIERNYDIGDYSLRAVLSRRPETSTSVSYAGMMIDTPQGQKEWGGVVSSGANIGLSWDQGGPYGGWSSLQYHFLTGENVEDNTRWAILGGGYLKLINDDEERLSIGASAFYMGYEKNLGEYALGNGAYYSPQSYFSLSLPVSYYGRYENTWAYSAYASISHSWSELDAPFGFTGSDDTGGGFGYSVRFAVERRISAKWYVGALLDAERSDSYDPNHFQLYVKYTFNNRWQPIQSPPEPITLYADYY